MPNLQAAVYDRIQEQEHAGLQVISSLTLFYVISTLDTYFRRRHLQQVVVQLRWNWANFWFDGWSVEWLAFVEFRILSWLTE
jgi:hypothetical protein